MLYALGERRLLKGSGNSFPTADAVHQPTLSSLDVIVCHYPMRHAYYPMRHAYCSSRLRTRHAQVRDADVELLRNYPWPGNIRELQNVVERAVIISQGGPLRVDLALGRRRMKSHHAAVEDSVLSKEDLKRRERENLMKAIEKCKGKIYGPDGAAAMLGMKPTTLTSRIKKMNLQRFRSA